MRNGALIGLVLVPLAAFGRGSVRVGFGGGRHGGRRGRGGLSVRYSHKSSHSSLSVRFSGGACYYGGGSFGGSRSGYSYSGPGVYVARGWQPYSPYWHSGRVPQRYGGRVGPFSYTDAVVFSGTGGVVLPRRGAPAPAAPRASAGELAEAYARLPVLRILDRGDELFVRGDFAGAVTAYRAAVAKAPKDPTAAVALGHGLFAVGAYAEAAGALRRGVRLFPELVQVGMDRRRFYGDPRAFDAQMAHLARFLAASPDARAARFVMGYNCFFSKQRAKAKEHFAALGAADPEAQLFLREIARRG